MVLLIERASGKMKSALGDLRMLLDEGSGFP